MVLEKFASYKSNTNEREKMLELLPYFWLTANSQNRRKDVIFLIDNSKDFFSRSVHVNFSHLDDGRSISFDEIFFGRKKVA